MLYWKVKLIVWMNEGMIIGPYVTAAVLCYAVLRISHLTLMYLTRWRRRKWLEAIDDYLMIMSLIGGTVGVMLFLCVGLMVTLGPLPLLLWRLGMCMSIGAFVAGLENFSIWSRELGREHALRIKNVGRQLVRPSGRQLEGPSLAGGLVSDN